MNADKHSPLPRLLGRALTREEEEIIQYLKNTAARLLRPSPSIRLRLRRSPRLRQAWFERRKWSEAARMRAIAEYGRPYAGITRPKQYRKRKAKTCFYSAGDLALKKRGTYVEGYASHVGRSPLHHAWVTLDGEHAIDTVWDDPANCHYVGIAFPTEIVDRIWQNGYAVSLLETADALEALLGRDAFASFRSRFEKGPPGHSPQPAR